MYISMYFCFHVIWYKCCIIFFNFVICFEFLFFLELFYHEIDGWRSLNLPCSSNKREVIIEITMDRSVPCCIEEKLAPKAGEFVQILLCGRAFISVWCLACVGPLIRNPNDRCDRFKSTAHRVLFVIDRWNISAASNRFLWSALHDASQWVTGIPLLECITTGRSNGRIVPWYLRWGSLE